MKKSQLSILYHDQSVDLVFIDRSVLGTQIKFMERLPRDEAIYQTVSERLKAIEKTPAQVTLCLPRPMILQRTLSYPAAVKEDLGSMIPFEATRHVPLAESDRLLAYAAVATPDEKQMQLNLVAAQKSKVAPIIQAFEEAGVPIDEALPLSALLSESLSQQPTLLARIDEEHIELALYGNGLLQDSQLLPRSNPGFSPERVITAARQMAAKHKKWLGDEGIGQLQITGPAALEAPFEADLGTAFGLKPHALSLPDEFEAEDLQFASLLTAATLQAPPTLNLLEHKIRKVPLNKRTLITASLGLILLLEALICLGLATGAPRLQRRKVAIEIKDMKKKTASIQKMKDKNRVLRKQLFQLESVSESHLTTMEMLKILSDTLPEDSYIRQISYEGSELQLRGYSKEPDKLPELLLQVPFVKALSTSEIGRKENEYHEFTLGVTVTQNRAK